MKKTLIVMIIGIILINLCSAIYPGESKSIDIGVQYYHNYTIINNVSYIPVNISSDNSTALIFIPTDYPPGTFTITFYGARDVQDVKVITGDGGCLTNWSCSDWSSCINGNQTRTCTKIIKYCYVKPVPLVQNCTIAPETTPQNTNTTEEKETTESIPNNRFLFWIWILSIVGVLVIALIVWRFIKSTDKNNQVDDQKDI